jgi:ABC-type Mn2+/Zn2+ transport system permease subunit
MIPASIGDVWHWAAQPWEVGFMRLALAEVVLLGVVGGALGCWVVFYGLSYSAESLAHALFPGLVASTLLGFPLVLGGVAGVVVAAVAVAGFGRTPQIGRDTAVGVVISALFGVGVLMALSPASPPGIQELLFGNILGLSPADILQALGLSVVVLAALRILHAQLLVVGFDRGSARAMGGRPVLADAALLVLLALAVVVAAQGLGNLLAPAVLVGPAGAARLLTRRMIPMMVTATLVAVGSGITGLYLSYYAGTAGGASVAGVIVLVYLAARARRAVLRRSGERGLDSPMPDPLARAA